MSRYGRSGGCCQSHIMRSAKPVGEIVHVRNRCFVVRGCDGVQIKKGFHCIYLSAAAEGPEEALLCSKPDDSVHYQKSYINLLSVSALDRIDNSVAGRCAIFISMAKESWLDHNLRGKNRPISTAFTSSTEKRCSTPWTNLVTIGFVRWKEQGRRKSKSAAKKFGG